jgi:hypothetical protein
MAVQGVNGMAIAAVGAGVLFVWSGIKGAPITTALRSLLSGKQPAGTDAFPVEGTTFSGDSSSSSSSSGNPAPTSGGPAAGSFSNAQLQSLWRLAGGSSSTAATAACIAEHESSGNSSVTSSNPDGGINVGLWQLDTKGKGAGYSEAQLKNPLTNARVAVKGSSDGRDWSAWSTAPMCGV